MGENVTTKLNIDISDLKKNVTEANRRIRSINAEFKAATAGMEKWSDSADGLTAKMDQLSKIIEQEKVKLSSLKQQYELVAEAEGKDSVGAEKLAIRLKNQEAVVKKAEASLKRYSDQLTEAKEKEEKSASAIEQLRRRIGSQEKELEQLKDQYKSAVLQFGESSEEAKKLGKTIEELSSDLGSGRKRIEELESAADGLDSSIRDAGEAAEKSGDGFTVMKGAMANLIADGIKKLAAEATKALQDIASEADTAYNSFQVQTGASAESMEQFKKQIDELYKSNFGESMNDVADCMAEVKQQTGEMDPTKLKDMTENAITLRDSFGYDMKEQMRAVKMLMDQFGVSGEEAFNLIIQGSQKGLDKNGDLLDTINEYGVHYKQLGYSADDFFNMLESGSKAGTFSIDKLGDATKEFGIKTKDTASATQEGFELLGYSTGKADSQIQKTKDTIEKLEKNLKYAKMEQDGFNKKTNELTRLKNADKIKEYSKQLEAAKGELKNLQKAEKGTSGTVDDLQKSFAAGGKKAQKATKEVMNKLLKMKDKVKQNQAGVALFGTMWEDLGIEGVKALMNTNGTMDKTKKSMEEIKKIKYDDVNSRYKALGRTVEMELFAPLAQKMIPKLEQLATYAVNNIGKITTGIKVLGVTAGSVFAIKKIANLIGAVQTGIGVIKNLKAATTGAAAAQELLNVAQSLSPMGIVAAAAVGLAGVLGIYSATSSEAKEKTEELTEAQENEKEKLDELNQTLDDSKKAREEAISDTQSEFGYYEDLKKELDGLVDANGKVKKGQKDRVDFILGELNKAYGTELKRTGEVIKNYKNERKEIEKLMKVKEAQAVLEAAGSDYETAKDKRDDALAAYNKATDKYLKKQEEVEKAKNDLDEIKKKGADAFKDDIDVMNGTCTATDKYRYSLIFAEKEVDNLNEELDANKKEMEKQEDKWVSTSTTITNYEKLKMAVMSGSQKKIKKAMKNMVNDFQTAETGTKRSLEEQVKNFEKNYDEMKKSHDRGAPGVTKAMVNSAKKMVDKAKKEVENFDTKEIAKEKGESYAKGLETGKDKAGKSAKKLVKAVKKEFKKIKTVKDGENFVQGLIDGLKDDKKNSDLEKAALAVAGTALTALKTGLDEHSPSKKTKAMGVFYTEGFANGIIGSFKKVGEAVALLSKKSLRKLKEANNLGEYEKAGEKVAALFEKGIEKQEKRAEKAVNALIKKAVNSAKKQTKSNKLKKSFSDLGEKMISSFEKSFSAAAEKATDKVRNKIEKLTQTAQEKYDVLKDLQDDLEKRLSDGELYKEDDAGNVMLTDFKSETAKIIQFGKNMETLKGKLSSELMAEIAGLDTEAGVKLTNKLLSLNSADLNAYNQAYTEKLNASKNVASRFYAEQIKKVQGEYSKKLKKVMSGLEEQLQKIGENAIKGFIKGFSSNKELDKATKQMKEHLLKSIKKELGIHSPSRVMEDEVGVFIPQGITNGVMKKLSVLRKAMEKASDSITQPMKNAVANANLDVPGSGAVANNQSQQGNTIKNINFYQTNNSPKALSRWEIWRQSRNMLGGIQNV